MPTFLVTKKIIDTSGPLPIKEPFVLKHNTIGMLFVSGSVFSNSRETPLSIQVTVDGNFVGRLGIFANPPLTHLALVPEIFELSLSSGNHVVGLAPLGGTVSDGNDFFTVTFVYPHEVNPRAVKKSRAVKTTRKRG